MKKLFLSTIFGLATVFGIAGGLGASFHLTEHSVKADDASLILPNEDPTPLSKDELSATVTSSAITDISQTFKVTFSSSTKIYDNGRYKNVYVKVLDSSFAIEDAYAEGAAAREAFSKGEIAEYSPAIYEVSVMKIAYAKTGGNKYPQHIVIPEYINPPDVVLTHPDGTTESTYDFRFHITEIESEVVFKDNATLAVDWTGIESITIPSSVDRVADRAFVGAAEAGVTIYCMDDEATRLEEGWSEFWTDTDKIVEGRSFLDDVAYEDLGKLYVSPTNTAYQSLGNGDNYLLSYQVKEGEFAKYSYPFVLEYKFYGDDEVLYKALPLYSSNSKYPFDGIGSSITNTEIKVSVDIPLSDGKTVDPNSLVFHNACHALRNLQGQPGYYPDFDRPSYRIVPRVAYSAPTHFNDIIDGYKVSSISNFFDYTDVKISWTIDSECYANVKPSVYAGRKSEIDKGTLAVRVQMINLTSAKYNVTYKDPSNNLRQATFTIDTPIAVVTIGSGVEIGFMFTNSSVGEGFDPSRIVRLELTGFTMHLDLFSTEKNFVINNSQADIRFATIVLMDETSNVSVLSVPMIFLITIIAYVLLFAAGALALYFYRKARYKNDEFRRVVTKDYVIAAVKNFIGFFIVLMAVLCILGRWVWLNNSIVVFNPIDVGVIIFTIVGAIFIGFTIKNLVNSIKLSMERREKAKLRLDQDVVEDGTN